MITTQLVITLLVFVLSILIRFAYKIKVYRRDCEHVFERKLTKYDTLITQQTILENKKINFINSQKPNKGVEDEITKQ